mmetsp:Transcript_42/g.46  ORF Transcript_42/g.46 Transcript_42/m.46 type:complete len:267 (+) Transcript_42:1726-2526(+)|eukprot:CAMPEP_0198271174 /NCGR_PEP_ID=MMETSP1447-20131203/48138_1 /TAXON_ID=420782 /ORGANISM="Chaetoceros dichaeta, Strain CCMP1751" /LENGTH=266 /DNA_ID=CAMNT_0043963609 /DNA_START=1503 /DNA_END=2303 /DNA_ORIENTATION=-
MSSSTTGAYTHPVVGQRGAVANHAISAVGSRFDEVQADMGLESNFDKERRLYEEHQKARRYTLILRGLAIGGMVTALIAIIVEDSFITLVAFSIPLVTCPYMMFQRTKLNRLPSLCELLNSTRQESNRLSAEIEKLAYETNQLEHTIHKLKDVEGLLEQQVVSQGRSVNQFRAIVKENGSIQRQLKKIHETHVIEQLLTAIMKSNHDNGFHINDNELEILIARVKNLNGIRKDADVDRELRSAFQNSNSKSMRTVFGVAKELLEKD